MALLVADAFEQGGQVLVEAGTGTGKTLAYLVPAILSRQRVLVSTGTKNLQEQIYFKDLPILARALGVPFTATYMKGRANYLCLQRLETLCGTVRTSDDPALARPKAEGGRRKSSSRRRPDSGLRTPDSGPSGDPFLAVIVDWARETERGDRAELADLPEDLAVWNDVAATSEGCLGSKCPHYDDCFVTRMRQRAAASDVVIVNHHLLCADAAVRQGAYGEVIPACAYAVIDEAHQLEDVATQYFGVSVGTYRVEDLCRDAERTISGEVPDADSTVDVMQAVEQVRDKARIFFMTLQFQRMATPQPQGRGSHAAGASGFSPGPSAEDRQRLTADLLAGCADQASELIGCLDLLDQACAAMKGATENALAIGRRAGEVRDDLRFLVRACDQDYVFYLEMRGRGVFLRASPIEASRIIRDRLLDRYHAVALTSATLSVAGSFDYIRSRLGVRPTAELRLESEFDYAEQAILYLPPGMPDPRSPAFTEAAARQVVEILRRTSGRAFVLFTSYATLRGVQPVVEQQIDYPVLVQGTAPRSVLLQQFRNTPNAVLLATSSFWQGVDVVGEALSCVIVDKLPFASPADPITSARMDAIARRGGDSFWEYSVPLAILTLQQGLGRLIRHRRDRGVLSVLDPRLRTKGYGATFLEALPPAPIAHRLEAIERFFAAG